MDESQNNPTDTEQFSVQKFLGDIENQISYIKNKINETKRNRKTFFVIACILGVFLIFHYTTIINIHFIVTIFLWVIAILFLLASIGTDPMKFTLELEKYESMKRLYFGLPGSDNSNYFDKLVNINIDNLGDYYRLVKVHSRQSFLISVVSGIVGLIFIIIGISVGFKDNKVENITYISTASGILIEFITSIFFYLYNKNVRQLKEYHDSLLDVQNILLSFKLIETTKDDKEKSVMIQKMIEFLVGKKRFEKK
jgi:hypothetical protein